MYYPEVEVYPTVGPVPRTSTRTAPVEVQHMQHQSNTHRYRYQGVYHEVPGHTGPPQGIAPQEPGYHPGDTSIQVGNDGGPPVAHGPPGEYIP